LENIGAIGILSSKKSDMGGSLPMTPEEKEGIQKDWLKRQKDQLILTEADVSWTPMSYPTKDLMLFEELTEDKMAIIDAYGLSYYLFSQSKGATFTNVKEGMKMSYQDTIIPETEQMYATMSHQLGLTQEGLTLYPCFKHIAVLQSDQNAEASAMNLRADAVNKIINAGVVLDEDEKRSLLGL
jgi:phage portal protein BeeE